MSVQNQGSDLDLGDAVEVVYDAVLDRSRFDELISLALKVSSDEGQRSEFQSLLRALDTHVLTAEKLLQNIPHEPVETETVPVISIDQTGRVQSANNISQSLLGIATGDQISLDSSFETCLLYTSDAADD